MVCACARARSVYGHTHVLADPRKFSPRSLTFHRSAKVFSLESSLLYGMWLWDLTWAKFLRFLCCITFMGMYGPSLLLVYWLYDRGLVELPTMKVCCHRLFTEFSVQRYKWIHFSYYTFMWCRKGVVEGAGTNSIVCFRRCRGPFCLGGPVFTFDVSEEMLWYQQI